MIFRKPTPNCSICEWRFDAVEYDKPKIYCKAQGSMSAEQVYDSRNCRKLFREKLVAPWDLIPNEIKGELSYDTPPPKKRR